jgi:peptidyl-tRNA hydrolase, PTH1 family
MALFQKKPQVSSSAPLYTLGLNKTLLIVGLGNIGKKFDGTRHNIGFAAVDSFATSQNFDAWMEKKDMKCHITTQTIGSSRVIVIKPTTLMNLSGEAIQAVAHFYKVPNQQIVVVHDELDIPFGSIRTRIGGSAAGNNGIKSAIQHIGEDFGRLRVGIKAKTPMSAADFVLAKFSKEEQAHMPALYKETTAILTEFVYGGQLLAETRDFII